MPVLMLEHVHQFWNELTEVYWDGEQIIARPSRQIAGEIWTYTIMLGPNDLGGMPRFAALSPEALCEADVDMNAIANPALFLAFIHAAEMKRENDA